MTIAKADRLLVGNLRRVYQGAAEIPVEEALRVLRATTGQDFGMNADAWEIWLRDNYVEWERRYFEFLASDKSSDPE